MADLVTAKDQTPSRQTGTVPDQGSNPSPDKEPDADDESDEDEYSDWLQSVRTETGLETGIRVTWPGVEPFLLSTCLPATEMAPLFHGTQWAGTRIWRAAVVAVQYLLSPTQAPLLLTDVTNVLELGCGLGLPGMILHALRQSPVVLSDKESLLTQLRDNIANAFPDRGRLLQAEALDWSDDSVHQLLEKLRLPNGFDLVLNCDCVFEYLYGDSWKHLVTCQEALFRANPHTVMITSVERRRGDGLAKYLAALETSPSVQRVVQLQLDFKHAPEVELYRVYGKP
ncbi:predicted protein [Phaeodactylum tricornutum CCAP 1055/1]|jgi:SAM-dependent methyltransferase|uniref:Uncharacterized protein n=1 Tax=Phaeodactylum tricornutum (strain CCAP 1055/1) TaxID=556484 RepID=B7G4U7_PHATC|nr:predicted protein [Phaeodactylum tricornutum CCAP 1055/1]EEC46676.1 predicted protein [Phaeodactylum tricornutum CCAP 1055/1]|eukprot:XP_002182136.1 predicted protein [Phaeodactylum tricornutum CCAP 1055/1]